MMNELPGNWELPSLQEVITATKGKKPKMLADVALEGTMPYIDIQAFEKGKIRQYADITSSKLSQQEDILIVWDGARCGLVGIGYKGAIGSTIAALRPVLMESKYLFYFLQAQYEHINSNPRGTGIPHLDPNILWAIKIPLPPLAEQRRIVAKLEHLLGKVEACQKRLARIPHILKRFRQAILAAACSGRLTEDWREQNQGGETAEELFSKIQNERTRKFSEDCEQATLSGRRKPKDTGSNKKSLKPVCLLPEIPETWKYFRLEELSYLVTDGTHKTPEYIPQGVRFLSVKNVRPFSIQDADVKYISEQEYQTINSRCNPEKGDILYTKIGATFGYAAQNKLDYPFSIFVSLALVKPVTSFFISGYVEIVLNSEIVFSQARERISGIGTPDLHLIEIRDFRIPLPPLAEQHEIVRRVEALFQLADRIEERYRTAKAAVDGITQAILAKAFRGELVPQEPSDEPASVLLERIRQERESSKPGKKKRSHVAPGKENHG